jgi:hypothetical protein
MSAPPIKPSTLPLRERLISIARRDVGGTEKWRCKSAAAFGWDEWARDGHARAFDADDGVTLHAGDIVVFSFSHIGILYDDAPGSLFTIEANTNDAGGRDGDGIWQKTRAPRLVRRFVRLLE